MRRNLLIIAAAALLLTTFSCQQTKKADPSSAEGDSITTKGNETPTENASTYDATDATAFGLKGNVKKVVTLHYEARPGGQSLVRGSLQNNYNDSIITFNEQGQVTCDAFANPYTYDAEGKFIKGRAKTTTMKRNEDGRIISYDHQIKGEGHWNSYNYEFKYDELGRMQEYTYTGWEEIFGYKYIYDDDETLWPVKITMEGQACADLFESEMLYRYLKFDDEGNWTEREVSMVERQGVDDGSDNPEMETSNSYFIEKREITYY